MHPALCPVVATQGHHATADKLSADSTPPAQHKERHVVTLRYEARAEREARDTRTGLAAEPLVPTVFLIANFYPKYFVVLQIQGLFHKLVTI